MSQRARSTRRERFLTRFRSSADTDDGAALGVGAGAADGAASATDECPPVMADRGEPRQSTVVQCLYTIILYIRSKTRSAGLLFGNIPGNAS